MFRKTGLGQQLEIIPGPGQPGAQPAGPGPRLGTATTDEERERERRLLETLRQADPNGWTQPGAGRGR